MTEPLRDIGPKNPPINLGEDPFLIWFRYGLGDLFFWAGRKFGTEILDGIPERLDGMRYAVLDALHEAKGRLEPRPPNSFRLDTRDIEQTGV